MALASDVSVVRNNTNEMSNVAPFTDEYIGGLIDALSVTGATLNIWEQKAAQYSSAVDVTEAGASHKFSDLFKNAQAMVTYWRGRYTEETGGPVASGSGVRVKVIERAD